MSTALFELGGLRFWNEAEIKAREAFIDTASFYVKNTLSNMNRAWAHARCEGPILHPRSKVSDAYGDDDIFVTNHTAGGEQLVLRPETTPSSYAFARRMNMKLPLCVWQAGISSRRETNDGASAAKMRFNSFWQLEFQCIYQDNTKADYRAVLVEVMDDIIGLYTGCKTRIVESDRLPSYSESTLDIEVLFNGRWTEAASCSIRTDYNQATRVCEIAIGLDRIVTMMDIKQ